jgi:hypothetical protein
MFFPVSSLVRVARNADSQESAINAEGVKVLRAAARLQKAICEVNRHLWRSLIRV